MGYFNFFALEGTEGYLDVTASILGMSLASPVCRPSPCTLCKGLASV